MTSNTAKLSRLLTILGAVCAALALAAAPAFAHTGPGAHDGFSAGLAHPVLGLDHLLAMVAVGWAAVAGRGAGQARLWALPLAFVATMAASAALAFGAAPGAWAEAGILLSLVGLAGLLAIGPRASSPAALALVILAAAPHGAAHGAELPAGADALSYLAGFSLATAGLHLVGVGLGLGVAGFAGRRGAFLVRLAGAAGLATVAAASAF